MPSSTHFYLEYLLVQWGVQALNITRYLNLIKYVALRQLYGMEEAKKLSEPEDQDFYGIGSLSARATLNLTIALVFCTLSPFICVIGIICFGLARLVHGYLFMFAETKKADLGGDFFFRQLVHTQQGLFLYVVLMTGVLMEMSDSWVPGAISASSFAYLMNTYYRFHAEFQLREMGLHEMEGAGGPELARLGLYSDDRQRPPQEVSSTGEHYKQPELPPPPQPEAVPLGSSAFQPAGLVAGSWTHAWRSFFSFGASSAAMPTSAQSTARQMEGLRTQGSITASPRGGRQSIGRYPRMSRGGAGEAMCG